MIAIHVLGHMTCHVTGHVICYVICKALKSGDDLIWKMVRNTRQYPRFPTTETLPEILIILSEKGFNLILKCSVLLTFPNVWMNPVPIIDITTTCRRNT